MGYIVSIAGTQVFYPQNSYHPKYQDSLVKCMHVLYMYECTSPLESTCPYSVLCAVCVQFCPMHCQSLIIK